MNDLLFEGYSFKINLTNLTIFKLVTYMISILKAALILRATNLTKLVIENISVLKFPCIINI
jgi:hypothetical protein